jgi:hypothetical protein
MQTARKPFFVLVASVGMLLQSAVFAVESPIYEVIEEQSGTPNSKDGHFTSKSDGKDDSHGFAGMKGISLESGQIPPVLEIQVGGEISVSDKNVTKTPWSSKSFESNGKVQLVQYVAANRSASRQNKPFNDALIEKKFSSAQLSTTVIVQMADTLGLVKGIVANQLAKNKAKHETINFVLDENGVGLQRWGMKNKSYAIIVLDASGKVLFVKDGPLSEIEIESTIELIENQMT